MASPSISQVYPTPSSIPIRSNLSGSLSRNLPLQARTRSMSKLNLASLASSTNNKTSHLSKTTSTRSGLGKRVIEGGGAGRHRRPLTDVDVRPNEDGKRKSQNGGLEQERAVKHRKFDDNQIVLRPPTPPRPHIHSTAQSSTLRPPSTPSRLTSSNSFQTPIRQLSTPLPSAPTPARDLLRMKIDDEDDEEDSTSPNDSPPINIVARPPTPPRKHIETAVPRTPSQEALVPTQTQIPFTHTPVVSTSPQHTPPQRIEILSEIIPQSVRRMDFSTPNKMTLNGSQSPLKARPFVPTPVSNSSAISLIAPSVLETPTVAILSATSTTPPSELLVTGATSVRAIPATPRSFTSAIPRPTPRTTDTTSAVHTSFPPLDEAMEVDDDDDMDKPEMENQSIAAPAKQISDMGPPTRIPAPKASDLQRSVTSSSQTSSTLKRSAPSTSSLPIGRRPSTRPTHSLKSYGFTSSSSTQLPEVSEPAQPSTSKRKPSYPSSLGSGPLARPVSRMVSNPIVNRAISNPTPSSSSFSSSSSAMETDASPNTSPRSVSDPAPRTNPLSLSMSSRRRDGFSLETSKSLMNLTDALEKLKVKKLESSTHNLGSTDCPRPRTSTSVTLTVADRRSESAVDSSSSSLSMSTTTAISSRPRLSNHRPRASLSVHQDTSFSGEGDSSDTIANSKDNQRSIAALMCASSGGFLKGVIAFVDVYTAEGEDASPLFTEMLRSCGAKVITRLTESITHVIYKSGRPTTLQWYRKQEDPKPHIVGIGWVTGSKKAGKRLLEENHLVDVAEEDVFQKRRKSMEPKQLALRASVGPGSDLSSSSRNSNSLLTVPESSFNISQARKKSLLYAPKIGSPLKKAFVSHRSDSDNDDDDLSD